MIQPCRPGTESAKAYAATFQASKNAPLRAVIFLLIVVLLYSAAANVLSVNNTWDMRHIRGFIWNRRIRSTSSCSARASSTGFSSPLAWQQYGFTSYPLAVSSMPSCL